MNLTIKQHKVAALKHARKLISSGKTGYICIALSSYAVDKETIAALKAVEYLHQYINEQLKGEGALDYWLLSNGNLSTIHDVQSCWCSRSKYGKKIRQTRLNWIDWMLKCYEGSK